MYCQWSAIAGEEREVNHQDWGPVLATEWRSMSVSDPCIAAVERIDWLSKRRERGTNGEWVGTLLALLQLMQRGKIATNECIAWTHVRFLHSIDDDETR